MNLVPASRTTYDVPIVIAVNTSERMRLFADEINDILIELIMSIRELRLSLCQNGRDISVFAKVVHFNDDINKIDEFVISKNDYLFKTIESFHGIVKAETLFTCLNNIIVPALYRENHVPYGNVPVVFVTDGLFEDDVEVASRIVKENIGFRYSTKIGIYVGDADASIAGLIKLTGNSESCIRAGIDDYRGLIFRAFYDYRFDDWTIDDIEDYLSDLKEWVKSDISDNHGDILGKSEDMSGLDNTWKRIRASKEAIINSGKTFRYAISSKTDLGGYKSIMIDIVEEIEALCLPIDSLERDYVHPSEWDFEW